MKKFFIFILLIFNFLFLAGATIKEDIEIYDMKLSEVITILARETDETIICSDEVKNININAFFDGGSSLQTILSSIAKSNNINLTRVNGVNIFTSKEINKCKLLGKITDNFSGLGIKNAKIQIKNSNSSPVYSDEKGNFVVDSLEKGTYIYKVSAQNYETRGDIINIDKNINMLNLKLKSLDNLDLIEDSSYSETASSDFYEIDGKIIYSSSIPLYNISAEELKNILENTFAENIKISVVKKINAVVISAEKDILENAKKIIKEIDKNPKQVKISSQILDISNNLFEELGFDWVYKINSGENARNTLNAAVLGKVANVSSGNVFGSSVNMVRQFNSGNDILSLGINLLEASNDLVVSSMPSITISSGEVGEFKVTEEVIVGEKYERENKKQKNYIAEPIFKEAGLILKVKPLIKNDNYIVLDISIELSDFKFKKNLINVTEANSGTFNSEGGSKIGRSLSTKVRVKDGDTILLGGLKKTLSQNIESKIPILGDIPIINFFFKNTSKKKENSDMYIKLTVNIED